MHEGEKTLRYYLYFLEFCKHIILMGLARENRAWRRFRPLLMIEMDKEKNYV